MRLSFIFTSLFHNHIIPLPQRQVNARNRKNSPDHHKKAVNITRATNESVSDPITLGLTGLLFCSLTDYSIIKLIKANGDFAMTKPTTARTCIVEAFLQLCQTLPCDKITVSQLTKKADYNRSTFTPISIIQMIC